MATPELQINKITRRLRDIADETIERSVMQKVGDYSASLIVQRTRAGFGVSSTRSNAKKKRLKRLSTRYIKQRQRLSRFLDGTTSPGKSNLTFRGAMLRSIKARRSKDGSVIVSADNRVRKGGSTNKDISGFVSEVRPFLNLSGSEIKNVLRFYDKIIKNIARKF